MDSGGGPARRRRFPSGQGRGPPALHYAEYGNKMDESNRFSGLVFLAMRRSPVVETEPMQACVRVEAETERICAGGTIDPIFF